MLCDKQTGILYLQAACYLILLILLYRIFFFRRKRGFIQFVKYVLVPLTFLGGLVIYFIGYSESEHGNPLTNGLMAFFSTGRMFVLGNDYIEIKDGVENCETIHLWFSIIGATAAFISVSILVHIFGKRLITRWKIYWDRSDEVFIFFGVNSASLSLAKDLLGKKSRLVIFIQKTEKNEDPSLYHDVEEAGGYLINRESVLEYIMLEKEESIIHSHKDETTREPIPESFLPEKEESIIHSRNDETTQPRSNDHRPANLKKMRIIKKVTNSTTHLFFLSDKEELNLRNSQAILKEIYVPSIKKEITIHIRTISAELEQAFQESMDKHSSQVKINFINQSEIASRQLIHEYNPVDWMHIDTEKAVVNSDFTVLVVGFNQTGNAVLKKLIESAQFVGSVFHAIVVDDDMQSKKGRFEVFHPGLISNYTIEFVETEPGKMEFYDLLKKHKDQLDYVILTLNNDALNIRTATEIQQFLIQSTGKRVRIIAQVNDNHNYTLLSDPFKQVNIAVFGRENDTFTENIVVRGELGKTAMKIHDYYNSKKPAGQVCQSWYELSAMKRLSNISAANHIYTKLKLAGLSINEIKLSDSKENFAHFLGKERIENLAKAEHLRWNALLFANGWNTWALNDIPKDATSNKIEIKKIHACLVSWEEIAKVKERFNEDYYAYDYVNVLNIFELVKDGVYTAD